MLSRAARDSGRPLPNAAQPAGPRLAQGCSLLWRALLRNIVACRMVRGDRAGLPGGRALSLAATTLLSLAAGAAAAAAATTQTLVVVEDLACRASHSQFFSLLEQQGHSLTFATVGSPEAQLRELGEWQYSGLVLAAPTAPELGAALDSATVADFVDAGHSVFVAGDRAAGRATRQVASQLGVEFDAPERAAIDHAAFDRADSTLDGDHTLIVADAFVRSPAVVGAEPRPVLYRGAGMRRAEGNELVAGVLTGAATTYSWSTLDEVDAVPFASAEDLLLVAGLQARNGARALVAGSWAMFSDSFFGAEVCKHYARAPAPSGNKDFADHATRWLFGSGGTLRVTAMRHELQGGGQQDAYTVKDTVSFGFSVEELDDGSEQWVPFVREDIQMEFRMLDPAYRLYMPHVGQGRYNISFMVPDVIGVYQFVLDYRRGGYTHLKESMQVDVKPPRHDGYERFLPVAYPYYASALSMIGGFFIFSLAFLYST